MHRSLMTLALLTLTACGQGGPDRVFRFGADPAQDTQPAAAPAPFADLAPAAPTLPSVEVPMPPARMMTDGLTLSVELAPNALHVWVAPSIGGADMMVWTDATPTPQALPAGAEFDATAWATRVYVRAADGQPVTAMTGTIRYEYAQL